MCDDSVILHMLYWSHKNKLIKYAYWLAAGFDAKADAETTENVIALFCGEK